MVYNFHVAGHLARSLRRLEATTTYYGSSMMHDGLGNETGSPADFSRDTSV